MSKAHYLRQSKSMRMRAYSKRIAKAKFWHAVSNSNARLNARRKPHGVK